MVRVARTLRMIRGLRGSIGVIRASTANPARAALTVYSVISVVVFIYATAGILTFENESNPAISTFGDAAWFSFTTLVTGEFNETFTIGGRVMSSLLVFTGIGLFGLLTAEVAALLVHSFCNPPEK